MKKIIIILALMVVFTIPLTACEEKSGGTIKEPEITVDYLRDDYSYQLIADGARTILGFVQAEKNGSTYDVKVSERKIVFNDDYKNGYYFADTNITKNLKMGTDARVVCIQDEKYTVVSNEAFAENKKLQGENLYTVYYMDNSAELIVATEPSDLKGE